MSPSLNATRRLLSDVEAAEALTARGRPTSRRTIRYLLERGALPAVRVGRARLVDPDDLERFLSARTPRIDVPAEPRTWLAHARLAAAARDGART